ncbi:MAG: metalloregulator ArsR/SmtB family transcription factor [Roseiarcus sp.]|jgi:ubiquinone/menaquinone biosynthesis C-methylase UbiE/DNA-binding transcriptional ArsR family regulator
MLESSHAAHQPARVGIESLLAGLAAAGEITRLRLLYLMCEAELTVSELVAILGQSQPRVSRHLRLLVEAGLAERRREGAWAFFRIAEAGGALARDLVARLDPADPALVADRARLDITREARRRQAAAYFAQRAPDWDHIRTLHAPEERVEAAIMAMVGSQPFRAMLDLGTGTGRMLELLAPLAGRAVGVDQSAAMLALARAHSDRSGLNNVQLRQGDIYAPPAERDAFDLVVIHQVLHFLDDPPRAVREAARALRPGGRLVVVDFLTHEQESLRQDYAHRHLGFTLAEIESCLREAGLAMVRTHPILPTPGEAGTLTVAIWIAQDPRILTAEAPPRTAPLVTAETA